MRIAALDLGSNSFHLLIVEARLDGSFTTLVSEKEMLRLGDVVARTGSIDHVTADAAIAVLARFRAMAEANHCDETVAYATAAVREALNGAAFVDRVRAEAGVEIKVIDGVREARLIFAAVRASVLIDRPPALCADLGGGSLELMVGDRSGLAFATSLRLGVGRLTAEFLRADPPTARERARLEGRVADALDPVLREVAAFAPQMLVGSSGTILSLARMAASHRDGVAPATLNQLSVRAADLERVEEQIWKLPVLERARLAGCDAKRSELLPAGSAVLRRLLEVPGFDEITLSDWALREGMVITAIGAHDRSEFTDDPRALRRSSVLSLCRRSNWRQRHARQVASIALALFDATSEVHGLGEDDRELLELAALLHDIGEHVSRTDHDRHTAYLIEHGGLRGFSPAEIAMLASVGRFHVRGTPRTSFAPFGSLDVAERRRVVALTAILRIADGLDTTHASVVQAIEVGTRQHEVTLVVHARGEAELELWSLQRKQELFEKTFGVALAPGVVSASREEYDATAPYASGLGLG